MPHFPLFPSQVILKFPQHEDIFCRELGVRRRLMDIKMDDFETWYVLPVIDWAVHTDHPEIVRQKLEGDLLVLPRADHSLADALLHGGIAGADVSAVREIMTQVVAALDKLHKHGFIHGNLKASNVCYHHGRWSLIDLEASVKVVSRGVGGKPLGDGRCRIRSKEWRGWPGGGSTHAKPK